MATDKTITANTSTAAPALLALEHRLTGWQDELFDVHALLIATRARLDEMEENDSISGDDSCELGRLIAMAAREVSRLASGGAA